jgi:hypothetical protein
MTLDNETVRAADWSRELTSCSNRGVVIDQINKYTPHLKRENNLKLSEI